MINGEVVTMASFEESDGLDNSTETPALWEVSLHSSFPVVSLLLCLSQSCWIPIVKAISEGSHDKRLPVKRCAVDALCLVISDKHAFAVPVTVLVTILHEIVIPAAQSLGLDLIQSVSEGTYSSSLAIPEDTTPEYKMKTELYQTPLTPNSNSNNSPKLKTLRAGVTADLLSTLCKVCPFFLSTLLSSHVAVGVLGSRESPQDLSLLRRALETTLGTLDLFPRCSSSHGPWLRSKTLQSLCGDPTDCGHRLGTLEESPPRHEQQRILHRQWEGWSAVDHH
jgi:hypothetical protein